MTALWGVTAQKHQRRLGLGVALGIDDNQFGPQLLPDRFGHVSSRGLGDPGGLVRQLARQVTPNVPDAPLLLHPSHGLAQKSTETLGAITGHAAQALPVQARLAGPLKKALPGRRLVFPFSDHRWPQQPRHTVGQQQHDPGRAAPQPDPQARCPQFGALRKVLQLPRHTDLKIAVVADCRGAATATGWSVTR